MSDGKTPVVVTMSDAWKSAIQPLVAGLKLSEEQVTEAIIKAGLVSATDDEGAAMLLDPDSLDNDDIKAAFPKAAKGNLNKAINGMRKAVASKQETSSTVGTTVAAVVEGAAQINMLYTIPDAPEGSGLLEALKDTPVLIVDRTMIAAALEALTADDLGLSNIPEKFAERMEEAARAARTPVSAELRKIDKLARERRYADINVDGRLVTEARKKQLLAELRKLPGAALRFHSALTAWYNQYESMRGSNLIAQLRGLNLYPPFDDVVSTADIVVGCLNDAFCAYGMDVAAGMAYEALKIREILNTPELHFKLGYPTREVMLQGLGCAVTTAEAQNSRRVAQYISFVAIEVPKGLPPGHEGPALESLYLLGEKIKAWMMGASAAPNGRGKAHTAEPYAVGSGRRDSNDPFENRNRR